MRIPVASEQDAFRWVFAIAIVIGLGVALGGLAEPAYGALLVAGAVIGVIAWELGSRDPAATSPLDGVAAAPAAAGRHGVLVIANETVGGRELREELLARLERAPEVRVICPILPSRAHFIASDIDRELAEARGRLDATLAWAREHHMRVTGRVSADTPLQAVADELRGFHADEVLVSTHPPDRSKWLESGLVEQLRAELGVPVHHVVVDLSRQREPAVAGDA
jgi:hypothetical protein